MIFIWARIGMKLEKNEVKSVPTIPWYRRMRNWLWGYDFFVSYHWASGGTYAVILAAKLRERGYDVFLDRAEYAMGDDWKRIGEVALRNTQRLVLVATREAIFESKPVEREVELFTNRHRQIIPIFFGDTFAREEREHPGEFLVLDRLPDATLYIEDAPANLREAGPSNEAVEKLVGTHGIMRRRSLRQLITVIALSLLSLFLVGALISAHRASVARNAEQQAKHTIASRLAESRYSRSQDFSDEVPLQEFLLVCNAAASAPPGDQNTNTYLDRLNHLVHQLPTKLVNLPTSERIEAATVSEDQSLVVVRTETNQVILFSSPDAKQLFSAEGAIADPYFDKDNNVNCRIHWFHPEPDPDSTGNYFLRTVWSSRGQVLSPVDDGSIDPDELDWGFEPFGIGDESAETTESADQDLRESGSLPITVTVSESGSVMFWKERSERLTTIEKIADPPCIAARLLPEHTIHLTESGVLTVVSKDEVSSSRRLGKKAEKIELFDTKIVIGSYAFDLGDLDDSDQFEDINETQMEPLDNAIADDGRRLYAWHFGWEAGDDLKFTQISLGSVSHEDDWSIDADPSEFVSFAENGRYCITGTGGVFRLVDLSTSNELASFQFAVGSSLDPVLGELILAKIVELKPRSSQGWEAILNDGGKVVFAEIDGIYEIRTPSGGLLTTPKTNSISKGLIAISPNGQLIATVKMDGTLQVWKCSSGYPVTHEQQLEGSVLDMRFTSDSKRLRVVDNRGQLITVQVLGDWNGKPDWLVEAGEALTGLVLSDSGQIRQLSQKKVSEKRKILLELLRADGSDMSRFLVSRFFADR